MPTYEGDGGLWLKQSTKMGKRVIPGTSRALFPCNVNSVLPTVKDNFIFKVKARPPLRGRKGVAEQVLGYKFNGEVSVAFRGAAGTLSTNVDVGPLVKSVIEDSLAPDVGEALIEWLRISAGEGWWQPGGMTLVHLTRSLAPKSRSSTNAAPGIVACIRRIAIQSLMLQNIPVEDYVGAGEYTMMEVDSLMDDLSDLDLDFGF